MDAVLLGLPTSQGWGCAHSRKGPRGLGTSVPCTASDSTVKACSLKTGESSFMPLAWLRQRPPWIGCELTTVEALSLLVASVCHWGQTVFALAFLAGAERVRHLEALPVRWALACS
jgi:hypothetical protein